MSEKYELMPSDLRNICNPKEFHFKTTAEVKPLDKVIGQQRAVRAIEFGLNMKSPGYNVFVTGVEGTGKSSILRDIATKQAQKLPAPCDWCLVNNFEDEFRPKTISVPSGKAVQFCKKVNKTIEDIKKELPKAFKSDPYLKVSSNIRNKYSELQRVLMNTVEKFAAQHNLHIEKSQTEVQIFPIRDGTPLNTKDLQDMSKDQLSKIEGAIRATQAKLEKTTLEADKIKQALYTDIEKLVDEVTMSVLKLGLEKIRNEYKTVLSIQAYLNEIEADIIENINIFLPDENDQGSQGDVWTQPTQSRFNRYKVNVLVHQETTRGAPVIFEPNPTYYNVFGRIEKRAHMGTVTTDFTMVQAGSLLHANGGFLIMEVESVQRHPFVWEALKRALQTGLLVIEDIAEETGFGTVSLRPQPIALDIKIILVGPQEPFELLQNNDSRFNKIFKVRADFDQEVERTYETTQDYARFIARACIEHNLLPFTPQGVAAIVEYSSKSVAKKDKLSAQFGLLHSILKEADYWARKSKAKSVSDKYVVKAFNEYRFRYNLYEEKIHESLLEGTIMVDIDDQVVGQVNALAVHEIGEFSFGRPFRITAETYLGKHGVINIERESHLSGSTHDKGVLILSGYLGRTFAQSYPIGLSISITFEQSYGGIDGDSASSTELYAILSSLSGIPIKQGIATTGSVNQKGQIQAIGDVNQKIEGFFQVCKGRGLTGKQGVIIPLSNTKNLMLNKEVIDAVKTGKFHIYGVSIAEEGIEILTGIPAGQCDQKGNFPEGTVYNAVQQKLKAYLAQSYRLKKEFELEGEDS